MKTVLKGTSTSAQRLGSASRCSVADDTPTRLEFQTPQRASIVTKSITAAHQSPSSPSATESPQPSSLAASSVPPQPGSLPLWGIWEMWCDFPSRSTRSSATHHHHSLTMSEKLAQYQPPNWLDSIKSIGLFDTAEGFWAIHDCTLAPSRLPNGSNYYLFRHNVAPMWEQEANRRGGKWVSQFICDQGAEVDAAWTALCVAAIGEQLPGNETELCGVSVSKRKSGYKISLWTRNASDREAQLEIGRFAKELIIQSASAAQTVSPKKQPHSTCGVILKFLRHCETLEACAKEGTSPTRAHGSGGTSPHQDAATGLPSTAAVKVPEALYTV